MKSMEVARLAGVSLRQLQWWDERHIISPAQAGHARDYTEVDAWRVMAVSSLRQRGVSLQAIRRAIKLLARPRAGYLIRSGHRWLIADTAEAAIKQALEARGAVIMIELPAIPEVPSEIPLRIPKAKSWIRQYRTEFSTYGQRAAL